MKRRYSRITCFSEGKEESKVVYLKTQIQWILFYGKLKKWDWTLRDTAWHSQDAPDARLNSGKKKAIWRHYPKRRTSWAKSWRAQFGGTTTWGNLTTSRLYQQSSEELGEKVRKLKPKTTTFYSLVKAPQTQKIVCLLWIRELQCTMLSKENWAQIQWKLWEGPKPHIRLTATGWQCKYTGTHQFLFMISICSQQCNYSIKRRQFYCFINFAHSAGVHMKTAKLHKWPKLGRHLLAQWTTHYFSLYQDCHHIPAAFFVFNIEINGSV